MNKDPLDDPSHTLLGSGCTPPTYSPSRLWAKPDTKSTPLQPHGQSLEDLRWKWAGSTILLSYGQMAAKAKSHILPWVDNILSRMIFYFRFSSWVQVALFTISPVLPHRSPPHPVLHLLPHGRARIPALPCPNCGVREAQGHFGPMPTSTLPPTPRIKKEGLLQSKCWIFTGGGTWMLRGQGDARL